MAADLDAFALDDILSPSSSSVYPVNDTEYDYDYADSVNQFNWNELVPTTIVYAITLCEKRIFPLVSADVNYGGPVSFSPTNVIFSAEARSPSISTNSETLREVILGKIMVYIFTILLNKPTLKSPSTIGYDTDLIKDNAWAITLTYAWGKLVDQFYFIRS
ncbi:unnamed protein product, partial [Nesidiocoris tenuis]